MSALPFLYFGLVFKSRHAIITHSPTRLSRACRFLWAEYHQEYWWYETLQQLRRLFLTGYVMLFAKRPNTRLMAALVVTFASRELSNYFNPYRDLIGARLFGLQQLLLIMMFLTGVLVRVCDDPDYGQDFCRSFGFDSAFAVSVVCMLMNLLLFLILSVMIILKAYSSSKATTLRLKNGKEPSVTLAPEHKYHTFVSHIWSTGQDQAAVIKRQICALLPTARVFLDVDDLVEIGDLENYVRSTSCMLLFLSKGYFKSRNCLREIRSTVVEEKPFVLVHERDSGKGGLSLDESVDECPVEMRGSIFTYAIHEQDAEFHMHGAARQVVPWHRVKDFQLLSLRLICSEILHTTPYYLNIARESSKKSALTLQVSRASRDSTTDTTLTVLAELMGLFIPGEAVSLNLSCEHLQQAQRIYYSHHNPGAYAFGKEMVRAITGITLVEEEKSGLRHEVDEEAGAAYQSGDRVLHVRHGLGVVQGHLRGGLLEIIFDNRQRHSYRPKQLAKKIARAPVDAPPPPAQAATMQRNSLRRRSQGSLDPPPSPPPSPSDADSQPSHASMKAAVAAAKLKSFKPSRAGRQPASSGKSARILLANGATERLLLYLNRDTWVGDDGRELQEIVRAAWQRGMSSVKAGPFAMTPATQIAIRSIPLTGPSKSRFSWSTKTTAGAMAASLRTSWLKVPFTLFDDSAPSARSGPQKARAAPTHPRAPPEQLFFSTTRRIFSTPRRRTSLMRGYTRRSQSRFTRCLTAR